MRERDNVLREHGESLEQRLQTSIEQIKGVHAARVVLDKQDHISEIHLVSASARRPKQIVRDTESLLHAHFGIQVDYRKISLVQLGAEDLPASRMRLQFVSAEISVQPALCVRVMLRTSESVQGVAMLESGAPENDIACATARATLAALVKIIGPAVSLEMQAAETVWANDYRVCLVVLHASAGDQVELLTGTCLVGHNMMEAASKAVLDAVNRRLPVWVKERVEEKPMLALAAGAA